MFMNELHILVNGLKNEEVNSIRFSFCKSFRIEKEEAAVEKLFEYLVENQNSETDDKAISLHVYGENKPEALKRLKSRLFSRILDTFTSDAFLLKEGVMDQSDKQSVRIRKKILQFRVLYRKKHGTDKAILFHILNEVIKEAKEYELYDVLADALSLKKYINVLRKGSDEITEMNKQIRQYQYAFNAVMNAGDCFFDIISNQDLLKAYSGSELEERLEQYLVQLKNDYDTTGSITILYYYKRLQLAHLQGQQKFVQLIDVCLDIINLLNKNKCINRTERMAAVYGSISKCLVFTGEFGPATENAKIAAGYYPPKSINYIIAKEQEFYSLFYGASYDKALIVLDELEKSPLINSGEFRLDKFLFFRSCIYFQKGLYKEALQICNRSLELTKDKNRWDLGIRYLKIMCLVELQLCDQAFASVEALRKIVGRNKIDGSSRDGLIYKALNEFGRASFAPIANTKLSQYVSELSTKEGEQAWKYYTHELIRFDEWISKNLKISVLTEKTTKVKV